MRNNGQTDLQMLLSRSENNPDDYQANRMLGIHYLHDGNAAKAITHLEKAWSLEQTLAQWPIQTAAIDLGFAWLAAGLSAKALEIVTILEGRDCDSPAFHELQHAVEVYLSQKDNDRPGANTDLNLSDRCYAIAPVRIIQDFGENLPEQNIGLSIVVPIMNEAGNLSQLYAELCAVLNNLQEHYEIIFINDGSTDGSRARLEEIAAGDHNVKVVQFRRNYGQTAALSAGFKYSRGSVVITMDGDLQNDPADIPRLLEKMAEGYDLVSGWRKNRHDRQLTRVIPSKIANGLINRLISATGVRLHDYGCTLKAYKRGIIKNINLYGEMHRFIPCFAAWLGVKVTEIPVNHRPRVHGQAKYNLSRVPRVIFDLLVVRFFADYMTRPIQFFGKIARKLSLVGLIILTLLTTLSLFSPLAISAGELLIMLAILMVAILQIITMGLLGEIMVRSYFEIQKKDSYIVESVVNEE